MSIEKFGLDVKKIVDNLIKQTHEDKLKWQGSYVGDSKRIRRWQIKHPGQDSYGVSLVELESMAVFHFWKLRIEGKVFSRNQKLISGLLNAIENQYKRLEINPSLQHIIDTAKKLENPE